MKILAVLLQLVFFLISHAQETVTGYVYEDLNKNQVRERREKGLEGIPVSNGQVVVLTDSKGKYELPVGDDDIIFMIKPSGYKTPVDQNNLPRFYYIHKPSGSPKMDFAGVEPTGNLPESVDFALYREDETDRFRALLFGDPQVYSKEEIAFFDQRIISELKDVRGISLGISLGDEVGNNPDLFLPYAETVKKIGVPWYNVVGNHDLNHDAKSDQVADESFERVFGPSTYSFNQGKTHFIILKDILWPDPCTSKNYWGGLTAKQMDFLKNDLALVPKDYLIVLAFHIPIWEEYVPRDIFRDEDREELFSLLKEFPNTLSISAHSHIQINKLMTAKDGWKQEKPHHHINLGTTCGSWYRGERDANGIPLSVMADGTPQGYAFLDITGNQYKITYKAAGYQDDYQMAVYHPRLVAKTKKSVSSVFVNFFMGSERDEVVFRVDDGEWLPMKYTIEFDPSYLHLLHEWDFTETIIPGIRPVEARPCYHLWKAGLPSNLAPGKHTIEVRARDLFGKFYSAESSYRIDMEKSN